MTQTHRRNCLFRSQRRNTPRFQTTPTKDKPVPHQNSNQEPGRLGPTHALIRAIGFAQAGEVSRRTCSATKCSASVCLLPCDSVIQFQTSAVMKPPSVVLLRWICSGQRGRGRMPERRVPPMRQDALCFKRQSAATGAGHRGEPS